jgi:adenine phosphoribosyltransferase
MALIDYENLIVDIPDYPEPGVIFKDITPLLADAQGLSAVVDDIANHFMKAGVTKVVGAEARGFLVGAPVAYKLGVGFVPARKPGKLPREVYSESYALEYGSDELEIHKDALTPDDRVLIVDDLVATAGTAVATARLIERAGATVVGFSFLLELAFLNPREIIGKEFDQEVYTLVQVG